MRFDFPWQELIHNSVVFGIQFSLNIFLFVGFVYSSETRMMMYTSQGIYCE